MLGWPVTEAPCILWRGGNEIDDTRDVAPALARRLADHIDIFWFIGHVRLLAMSSFPLRNQSEPCALTRRCRNASMLRQPALPPVPDIDKMPGDRRRGRHGRRHQMRAALEALPALEIAVRG